MKTGIEDYEDSLETRCPDRPQNQENDRDDDCAAGGLSFCWWWGLRAVKAAMNEPPPAPTFRELATSLAGLPVSGGAPRLVSIWCRARRCRCGPIWSRTGSRSSPKDIGAAYPGFDRAVPALPSPKFQAMPQPNSGTSGQRPTPSRSAPQGRFYGNEYFHILELAPIEGGYRAYVCDGMYNIFRQGRGNRTQYVSVVSYESGANASAVDILKVWRVEFTDTPPDPNATAMVTAPQRGPNPAPIGDVFGPWRVTGASDYTWGTPITREFTADETVDGARRLSQCADRMPHDYGAAGDDLHQQTGHRTNRRARGARLAKQHRVISASHPATPGRNRIGIARLGAVLVILLGVTGCHASENRESAPYPAVLLLMLTVCTLLYRTFRHNHWL